MSKKQERLGRNLGFFQVFAIGTGTMIGAGIFVLPSLAISTAGPAAVLAFILGGLITLATAISVVELATAMPKAGGSYFFISRALGPMIGTIIGLGAWLSLVFKGSFALVGLAEYLNVFFSFDILIVALIAGIVLIAINYRGSESSGNLQNFIVIGLIFILFIFITKGFTMMEVESLSPFMPYGASSVLETTGLIFISYLGITQLAAISEEVKNPEKNIPRAFLGSIILVVMIYAGVIVVINGMIPLDKLTGLSTPLVYAADLMAGTPGRIVITIAGFFATVSTANASILSSSRFPFAMSRDKLLPEIFIDIHKKFKTPYISILITGCTMLILLILFNVEELAKLGSTFNIMVFILVNLSVLVYRKNKNTDYKPSFRDPLFPITQLVGIVGSLLLLSSIGILPMLFALAVIIFGAIWYIHRGRDKIEFSYSIKDYVAEEEVSLDINKEKERVLVPIANPKYENDLLSLADKLGDVVIALNVVKVPQQISLSDARGNYNKKNKEKPTLETGFDSWSKATSRKQKYVTTFEHDIAEGIIAESQKEQANLILIGWRKTERLKDQVGSVAYKLLNNSKNTKSHMAILKGHFPKEPKRISVAYDGAHNSRYGLLLGKKLAFTTGATLKVIRVISPEIEREEKEEIIKDLKQAIKCHEDIKIEYEIIEKYYATDVILDETKESDITIVGDSSKRFKRRFLSTLPQRVANNSKNPVLIIKRHQPATKILRFFE